MASILVFLVIADGWNVQFEDWPKLGGVCFLLQACMLNGGVVAAIFVVPYKRSDNMLKLQVDPNLVMFDFGCKFVFWTMESWQPTLWFLVMDAIQDSWQHVQVQDWPKLNGVWFWMNFSVLHREVLIAIFVIFDNGFHPRWVTKDSIWRLTQFLFQVSVGQETFYYFFSKIIFLLKFPNILVQKPFVNCEWPKSFVDWSSANVYTEIFYW